MRAVSPMRALLDLAADAAERGEVPVAACVLDGQRRVIAQASNAVEARGDATAHAEMLVIAAASAALGRKYLSDCTLYVTLEPCAMCAGAIAHAKLKRVVFGAYDPKGGAVEHGPRFFAQPTCHHAPELVGGVMETECGALLSRFFQRLRN